MSLLSQPADPPSAAGCQEEWAGPGEGCSAGRVSRLGAPGGLGKVALPSASRGQRDTEAAVLLFSCKQLRLPATSIFRRQPSDI